MQSRRDIWGCAKKSERKYPWSCSSIKINCWHYLLGCLLRSLHSARLPFPRLTRTTSRDRPTLLTRWESLTSLVAKQTSSSFTFVLLRFVWRSSRISVMWRTAPHVRPSTTRRWDFWDAWYCATFNVGFSPVHDRVRRSVRDEGQSEVPHRVWMQWKLYDACSRDDKGCQPGEPLSKWSKICCETLRVHFIPAIGVHFIPATAENGGINWWLHYHFFC